MSSAGQPPLRAVFVDAAGTLFSPCRPVGEIYAELAGGFGFDRAGDSGAAGELEAAFRDIFAREEPLHGGLLGAGPSGDAERAWWKGILRRVIGRVGRVERFDAYFGAVYEFFSTGGAWRLEPGVKTALSRLSGAGLQLGVISNFDSRLPRLLADLGLAPFFDPVVYSGRVAAAKPRPLIFETALAEASVAAGEACHVGDRLSDDYEGARTAGLRAVLYDPWDRDVAALKVRAWSELPAILL